MPETLNLFLLPLPTASEADPYAMEGELTEEAARAWLDVGHPRWVAFLQVALDAGSRLAQLAEVRGVDARRAFEHVGRDVLELTQAAAKVLRTGEAIQLRRPDTPDEERGSLTCWRSGEREVDAALALLLAAGTDWLESQNAAAIDEDERLFAAVRELAETLALRMLARAGQLGFPSVIEEAA